MLDQIRYHRGDALGLGGAQHGHGFGRELAGVQHTGGDGILDVVVQKGNVVRAAHHAALRRAGPGAGGVGNDAVAHLPGQVEAPAVFFQEIHHPQALAVVGKATGAQTVQRALPRVAKGGMAQVVAQGDGLGQILVQPQGAGDGAGDLRDLQRVGQPGAVMVPLGRKKDLGLLLQAAERLAVDNAVAVPLVARADGVLVLRAAAAPGGLAQGGVAAQGLALDRLGLFADGHGQQPPFRLMAALLLRRSAAAAHGGSSALFFPLYINTIKLGEILFFYAEFFEKIQSRFCGRGQAPLPTIPPCMRL